MIKEKNMNMIDIQACLAYIDKIKNVFNKNNAF